MAGPLTFYGLAADGSSYLLRRGGDVPSSLVHGTPAASFTFDAVTYHPQATALAGGVDGATLKPSQLYEVTMPSRVAVDHYPWLRVSSSADLGDASFTFTNDLATVPGSEITFNVLPRSGKDLILDADGCLQWHGYSSSAPLYLVRTGSSSQSLSVSLIGGAPPT